MNRSVAKQNRRNFVSPTLIPTRYLHFHHHNHATEDKTASPTNQTSLLQPCNHPHRNTLASEVTFETSVLKMNRVYSAMTSSPQPNNILLCYPCPDSLSTKACYRYILMQCSTHLRSSAVPTSQQRIVPRRLASQRRWQRSLQTQQSTITKAICCPNEQMEGLTIRRT